MFDHEGYQFYLRRKISLENRLAEVGDTSISKEIESQMTFIEERLLARIKQAHNHAWSELDALRFVLIEALKSE